MLFTPIRQQVLNVTEIGVAAGQSLQMWHDFFPRAQLWGLDLKSGACFERCPSKFAGHPRVHLRWGNSCKKPHVDRLGFARESMDLVLDDGDHFPLSNEITLVHFWPFVKKGGYYVILACRNTERANRIAKEAGFPKNSYTVMKLELGSYKSVENFVYNLRAFKGPRPLDRLVCNAAVYLPADPKPRFTEDGFEMTMGVNHLSHFLLIQKLLKDLKGASDPRCIIVGSITGNSNTIAGGLVYPRADLGDLSGLKAGAGAEMADGGSFFGAKAYKDSKVCNMMTVQELHRRFHDETGITFSSLYPGCIAETGLFREKRGWFRTIFPVFMKYVTGGYVSEKEAGDRLAQVVDDAKCEKSGVYWSWNGNAQQVGLYDPAAKEVRGAGGSGGEIFENQYAPSTQDANTAKEMYDVSMKAVGL